MLFNSAEKAAQYACGGNATITLTSLKTGARYTYKISAPPDKKSKNLLFVSLLSGADNNADYTYLGIIKNDEFSLTKKSKMGASSKPVLAIQYFIRKCFFDHIIPTDLQIRHEGTCGRCGRTLTVPESIDDGFGPKCVKHVRRSSNVIPLFES